MPLRSLPFRLGTFGSQKHRKNKSCHLLRCLLSFYSFVKSLKVNKNKNLSFCCENRVYRCNEEDEKKDEEEENEEKDENEEEDEKEDVDIISEPFHCKHCGVFESIEHWAIDCSNNPIDISNSLIFVVEKSNENNSNKKEAVSFCKKLLPKINSLKDKRKAVRCLRGNFHQLSLPKIGPKPKIIILKALKQLILARWFARCNLKHSKNNPFKNLLRIKDYSSSTNIT